MTNRTIGTTHAKTIIKSLPYVVALLLWAALAFYGNFYLKKVENLPLFIFDKIFLKEAFLIPGGPLGVAGSFCTQFLHIPAVGAFIWVLTLLVSGRMMRIAFDLKDRLELLAYIPALLLIIANVSLGYNVFIMRSMDHFFGPTLGCLLAIVPVIIAQHIATKSYSCNRKTLFIIVLLVAWTALTYPLAGIYSLAGTLAAGVHLTTIKEFTIHNRIALLGTAFAAIFIVPLALYGLYTSFRLDDAWIQGLPSISNDAITKSLQAPYYTMLGFIILMPLIVKGVNHVIKTHRNQLVMSIGLSVIYLLLIFSFWNKDKNFRTELAMSQAVDEFNWQEVIDIYAATMKQHSRTDAKVYDKRSKALDKQMSTSEVEFIVDKYDEHFFEPTRSMVLYRDLALLKMNKALDLAFTMKDGGRKQKSRVQVPLVAQSGKQFYLQYGLVNMCYRWCLEDVIEHDWSVSTLKYMTLYSVVMQESELAQKYINKLSKTLFYRKWAREQQELSTSRSAMSASAPYKEILPYMCFEDQMSNDMSNTEVFLINHFLGVEPPNATPEYDRAALLFAMRTQSIPHFWERLMYYVNSNDFSKLPQSVQEAAHLYSTLEKDDTGLPIDKSVKESYDSFNRYVASHPIQSLKEAEYPYYKQFGKTFYYYYYFVRNIQTY